MPNWVGDDLLTEILIRLPLKSVFRCKCVSKRWHHSISHPFFRFRYVSLGRRHQRQDRLLGFFKQSSEDRKIWEFLPVSTSSPDRVEIEEEEDYGVADIITSLESSGGILKYLRGNLMSSNGLFLHGRYYHTKEEKITYGVYYIHNPVSKESYRLPPPPNNQWGPSCRPIMGFVVAAPDYASNASSSSSSIRYKVVFAEASRSIIETRYTIELDIFSSETGKWTQSEVSVNAETYLYFGEILGTRSYEATVIRGAIHWMAHFPFPRMICVYDPYKKVKLKLQGEEEEDPEVIEIIYPPPIRYHDNVIPHLIGESTDGLLQMVALDNHDHNFIHVWVYNSNQCRQWSLRHKMLQVFDPIPPFSCFKLPASLLALHPHNPEAVFINMDGSIYLYHFNSTTPRLEAIQYRGGHLSRARYFSYRCHQIPVKPYFLPLWHISPYPLVEARLQSST